MADTEGIDIAAQRVRAEDSRLWKEVRNLHRNGFVDLVTEEPRFVPRWAYQIAGAAGLRKRRPLTDWEYGYRVNLADMHRMHMRFLQTKLLHSAVRLHFNLEDEAHEGARALESTFRRYGAGQQPKYNEKIYSGC